MRRLSGTLDICLLVWLLATALLVVTGAWALAVEATKGPEALAPKYGERPILL